MLPDFFEFAKNVKSALQQVSLKTWVILSLFVVCGLLVIVLEVWGLVLGLVLIFVFVFFLVMQKQKHSLEEQRELLLSENREVERRFLKHEIDEKIFKQIVSDNTKKLISLEVEMKGSSLKPDSEELLSQLDVRKRHKLKTLLDEKNFVLSELNLAKQKYFKHEVDEKTFHEISLEKQKRLVELDTMISELYKQEAKDIMQETARKLQSVPSEGQHKRPKRTARLR